MFKGRPHKNLVESYGPEFAKTLEGAETGVWQTLQTREGWRACTRVAATIFALRRRSDS